MEKFIKFTLLYFALRVAIAIAVLFIFDANSNYVYVEMAHLTTLSFSTKSTIARTVMIVSNVLIALTGVFLLGLSLIVSLIPMIVTFLSVIVLGIFMLVRYAKTEKLFE